MSNFYPSSRFISDITNAQNAVVTFTEEHPFTPGEILGFRVSRASGMSEMNNREALVLSITQFTVTVNIDSTNFTPFFDAGQQIEVPAMAVPSASGIIPLSDPATVNLEDSFDNRPPS